nr:MAG TPA: hypothetical protein [Caudoviricetes sp.]
MTLPMVCDNMPCNPVNCGDNREQVYTKLS